MSYIEIRNVSKSFDGKPILKNISLSIERGSFVTFLGSSGCGKTTLLRSLIGLETVDSGKIYMQGKEITDWPAPQREMVMIFQQYCLFPTMSVYHNVSFPLRMKKLPKEEIEARVEKVLALVDLRGHEKKYPYQLSGGEQQRVSLARGLITNPKVLLLDEPFSAIDAKLRRELQVRVREIHEELGMTSIFVTHDQEEAMTMSDRICLFREGVVEQSGSAEELYLTPKTDYVASFIGNYNRFTEAEFREIAGTVPPGAAQIALRPEVIGFQKPEQETGVFSWEGVIKRVIPQGNIRRYLVLCGNREVIVDELSDEAAARRKDEAVRLFAEQNKMVIF